MHVPAPPVLKEISSLSNRQLSPASGFRTLSLTSPGGVKRPAGNRDGDEEGGMRVSVLDKRRKTMQDGEEDNAHVAAAAIPGTTPSTSSNNDKEGGENEGKGKRGRILIPDFVTALATTPILCSTPPSKESINQLVNESLASSLMTPGLVSDLITAPLLCSTPPPPPPSKAAAINNQVGNEELAGGLTPGLVTTDGTLIQAAISTPSTSSSNKNEGGDNEGKGKCGRILTPGFVTDLTTAPLICSTPPSRAAINQLVNESLAGSFMPPHAFGQPGQRRALSFHPLPSKFFAGSEVKKLTRAQSESATSNAKTAVERINNDTNLVGDGSKLYILPVLMIGKHTDLKEISSNTLVSLMEGKYNADVQGFEIIDCRYPYEFDGGHIEGAVNLHTKRQIYERFLGSKEPCTSVKEGKRHVVVFHCEFSSQRGPDMCRYVRSCDRRMNDYPYLHYPELYVLFGGYKAFFEQHKSYCIPQEYLTMVDEKFVEQCRYYKSLSKTDDANTKKKNFTRSEGPIMRTTSMKKLCLEHL